MEGLRLSDQWCGMPTVKKRRPPLGRTYLKEWRKFRNLTQEEAAGPLQRDATVLGRIENGRVPYDQFLLEAAANLYGCEPCDLLARPPGEPDPIGTLWEKMDRAQRKKALRLIEALIEA